jgi:predicted transglutaminase-like cysteine proteinase
VKGRAHNPAFFIAWLTFAQGRLMMKKMATASCQELARKKEELATRLGPRLHPDGFAEFSQLVEKACALQDTDAANSQRLSRRATEMLPQVERSVENILSIRDQINAKMLKIADEVMDEYDEALRELAK